MKTFLLTTVIALSGFLTSLAQAQTVPLTVDPSQSSVSISIAGAVSNSPLSGSTTLQMEPSDSLLLIAQPGESQITDLNLVVDAPLNFRLFEGFAAASTSPGGVTISMVTPGEASTPVGLSFMQLANQLALDGDLEISDSFGFAGGDQTFPLSGVNLSPVDFNPVSVTQLGGLIMVRSSFTITENINLGAGNIPLVLEVNYVANGIVPNPVVLGDVNQDGAVNCIDIFPFIGILTRREFQEEADCDQNESVNYRDIFPFIEILIAKCFTRNQAI